MARLAHGKQQNRKCTLVQFLGNFNFFRRIRDILSTLLNEKLKHRFPCAGVYLSLFLGLSLWGLKACPGVLGSNQHQALIVFLWSRCQCWGGVVSPQGLVSPTPSGPWIAGTSFTLPGSLCLLEKPLKARRCPNRLLLKSF